LLAVWKSIATYSIKFLLLIS